MLTNILLWCLFGLIAGVVAQWLLPGRDLGQSGTFLGYLITILIGIAGAAVGGYAGSHLMGWNITGFNLQSIGLAVAGAIVLLIVYRLVRAAVRMA
jgi:uncharacterized membrane protein YeaQ/YmgE (transglycosylase-associated protein family)